MFLLTASENSSVVHETQFDFFHFLKTTGDTEEQQRTL